MTIGTKYGSPVAPVIGNSAKIIRNLKFNS